MGAKSGKQIKNKFICPSKGHMQLNIFNNYENNIDVHKYVRYNIIEVSYMYNINITNFRKDIYKVLEQTVKFNEPVNISTKDGNAIVISEEDYRGLMETLNLTSIPEMKEKVVDGLNTPLSECVPEDEVEW